MTEQKPKYKKILVDNPAPLVRRITLNRPEKRNALSFNLRMEIFDALEKADLDPSVNVIIIRGAGKAFCAGYDLSGGEGPQKPPDYRVSPGWLSMEKGYKTYFNKDGEHARFVNKGWYSIWDMAKPVIAQVHGYCLAGGSELVAGCDLVYVSEDAQIGYPPVRWMSNPDFQYPPWLMGMRGALEYMLTGDAMDGKKAVRVGYANDVFPLEELEERVLDIAIKVSKIPPDLQTLNKRTVHQAFEIMGIRSAINAGVYLHSMGFLSKSSEKYMKQISEDLNKAMKSKYSEFGDYETSKNKEKVEKD